jgi:Trypsin-like peptidase domain/Effector-associated domain 1
MKLTYQEFETLADALLDAFTDYDALKPMARYMGTTLPNIAEKGPLPEVIEELITYAQTRDIVHELCAAARKENVTNRKLMLVSAAIGLEPLGVDVAKVPETEALPTVTSSLERMVDTEKGIRDFGSFALKIPEFLVRVCAVELGGEAGTGFLIGPETVLTNYHVVEDVISGRRQPTDVRLRFDYRRLRDGRTAQAGVEFLLADDWLVASSPYSAADKSPYDPANSAGENELDYAILRTREPVGLSRPSGPVGPNATRGWIAPLGYPYTFPVDSFLLVVQHPCDDPIGFDSRDDAVLRSNPTGTRVHYRINTMPGSSGSPVLNRELELVALHHAGEPDSPDGWLPCHQQLTPAEYNEGVPIAKIQEHLAGKDLSWVFGSVAP